MCEYKSQSKERESSKSTMKKYTKLILVVVAIISSFCFLIYKYRYDRLYNVLQVMEVFGTPDDPSFVPCKVPSPIQIPPVWSQSQLNIHLYSAYCESQLTEDACSTVTVLGVAHKDVSGYKCKLW